MKEKDYLTKLEQHDWYWRMSDSPIVRERGHKDEIYLKSFHEKNPHLRTMYEDYSRKFSTPKSRKS